MSVFTAHQILWSDNLSVSIVIFLILANTRCWANAGSMLAHRLRRWTNIKSTLTQHIVFSGILAKRPSFTDTRMRPELWNDTIGTIKAAQCHLVKELSGNLGSTSAGDRPTCSCVYWAYFLCQHIVKRNKYRGFQLSIIKPYKMRIRTLFSFQGIFCETQWPWPPLFSPSWLIQWSMGGGVLYNLVLTEWRHCVSQNG